MNSNLQENFQRRPAENEYGEFFAGYIAKVPGDHVIDELSGQIERIQTVLGSINEEAANQLHAPYIWTIKQVVGHLIDGEKVFGYRLHRFACGDSQSLPGFDHNPFVENLDYETVELQSLKEELIALRRANLLFVQRLKPEQWDYRGRASDSEFTVRSLAWITAGHINHHLAIIEQRVAG